MSVYRNLDQTALDAQYDNRAMVPDFPDHLAAWKRDSETARSTHKARLDLAYGPSQRERLDFFPADRNAPLHLFIHGGYWRAMDKADFAFPAPAYVAAGIAYGAIGYPLAPEATLDEIVDSIGRALHWILNHAPDLSVDPQRIVLTGHSAGGHLAAMARCNAELGPRLRGIVSISGLYDLEPIRLSYLNADLALDAAGARRVGPIHRNPPKGGPIVLAVGEKESAEYHRQQAAFGERVRAAGQTPILHDLAGHDHFSVLQALSRPAGTLFDAVTSLIRGSRTPVGPTAGHRRRHAKMGTRTEKGAAKE